MVPTHPKDGLGDEGGTKQGRIIAKAAARPQTWPPLLKGYEDRTKKWVPGIIRSRFPGGLIVGGDLGQIEPRTAGLLSGEPTMLAEFAKGKASDIHGDTAVQMFGPDVRQNPYWKTGDMRTDPRQWGKTGGLLMLYRGGWEKMQRTVLNDAGILLPDALCQDIVARLPKARPVLWAWQDQLIRDAHRRGYTEVPFTGQSRYFMGGSDYDGNEIVNQPVQTTAGNVLLRMQAIMEPHLPHLNDPDPPILLFHNWYDALYLDCKTPYHATQARDLLDYALQYVQTQDYWAMLQSHYGRTVPLVLDVKVH